MLWTQAFGAQQLLDHDGRKLHLKSFKNSSWLQVNSWARWCKMRLMEDRIGSFSFPDHNENQGLDRVTQWPPMKSPVSRKWGSGRKRRAANPLSWARRWWFDLQIMEFGCFKGLSKPFFQPSVKVIRAWNYLMCAQKLIVIHLIHSVNTNVINSLNAFSIRQSSCKLTISSLNESKFDCVFWSSNWIKSYSMSATHFYFSKHFLNMIWLCNQCN